MANWNGIARTNYVKIKDIDALMKFIDGLPIEVHPHPAAENFVSFNPADNDTGDFDHYPTDDFDHYPTDDFDDDGNEEYWDWTHIAEHFVEGQVLVVMTVGHEKAQYLTGYASAITWDGRVTEVNIDDIYEKAVREFGVERAAIADCTYQHLPEALAKKDTQ